MKAIVTGGHGFIGSHLVERLLKEGHDVITIDNNSTGRLENISHLREYANQLKIINEDITDLSIDTIKLFEDAELIYHLAALADIVPSIQKPAEYYNANVNGTFYVLEYAKKSNKLKKFIYAASSSCYGIPNNYPTLESSEIRPEYPYALTKRIGEELALHWGKLYNLPVISLRFFNVYGTRSRTSGTYGAVFGVFLAQKLANKPLTIVGDGKQTRDFTYVSDVVEAIYKSSLSDIVNEIMNVGSGNHYSVLMLAKLIGGDTVHIPKRPGEPDCTFADITKIKSLLDWTR